MSLENKENNFATDASKYHWDSKQTKLLIEEVRSKWKNLSEKNCISKRIWKEIAASFAQKGYSFSDEQCLNKWKNLKKKYKDIKIHNDTTGANRQNWIHFEEMDNILKSSPEVNPSSLGSSTKGFYYTIGDNVDKNQNVCCGGSMPKSNRKRTACETITLKDIYNQRERHHSENMQLREKIIKLLESKEN
ncbi:uncharacterized protein [Prorops nasuta]|uniref:uncharacterized protein n=1 Tax=Prorops nasuta TaxID=863751 RepID=UPI0034CE5F64